MKHALLFASVLTLFACDDTTTQDAGSTDGGTDADIDAGPPLECPFAAVTVGGTSETDAIADAPARCGQAEHRWLRDESLGSVTAYSTSELPRYTARTLQAIAESQGVLLPEPLTYDPSLVAITYTTQDRGALVEATALVAFPRNLPADAPPADVVLLPHGSSGYADGCGPTHDLGGQILAAVVASLGWVVVSPDYLGLRGDGTPSTFPHPYLVGQATAIASLDAARAVLRMDPAQRGHRCTSDRVLILGGSQGGHAALWAERLAPYYARELTIVGTVATVPPADALGEVTRALTMLVPASRSSSTFFGLASHWYGLGDRLNEIFVAPYDSEITAMLGMGCRPGGPVDPAALDELFVAPLLDAASTDMLSDYSNFGCMVQENGIPSTSIPRIAPSDPSYATLVVLGTDDDLVTTPIERNAVEGLCAGGMPIEYLECEGAGHLETTLWSLPEIIDFARARFAGETPTDLCTIGAPVRCLGTSP
jgi:acetyl esterase/lipase